MEQRTIEIKNTQSHGGKDLLIKSGDIEHRISPMDTNTITVDEGKNVTINFDGDKVDNRERPRGDVERENQAQNHGQNQTLQPNPNQPKRQ